MKNNNHLVIMAGGVGSRFWPMSTPETPKQFIDVLGVGKSLLQLTVERFDDICPISNVWVVTSKRYRDIVMEQLPGLPEENLLLEPCMRNTAPCIAYVAWKIAKRFPDANIVVSPSDHIVIDGAEFKRVIEQGLRFTENQDVILTLGMMPTRPETGYGYIKAENGTIETSLEANPMLPLGGYWDVNLIPEPQEVKNDILKVESFKEKPNLATAERYLNEGGYYWNAGIFVWNVKTICKALREHQPELAEQFDSLLPVMYEVEEQRVIDEKFPECKAISIDYAVMEHADNIYVLPADFGWSDLGTWGSLQTQLPRDEYGNAVVGDAAKLIECEDCIVHVAQDKSMVLQGLKGYIVAEHNGVLMVCRLQDEQRIKSFSESLKK